MSVRHADRPPRDGEAEGPAERPRPVLPPRRRRARRPARRRDRPRVLRAARGPGGLRRWRPLPRPLTPAQAHGRLARPVRRLALRPPGLALPPARAVDPARPHDPRPQLPPEVLGPPAHGEAPRPPAPGGPG